MFRYSRKAHSNVPSFWCAMSSRYAPMLFLMLVLISCGSPHVVAHPANPTPTKTVRLNRTLTVMHTSNGAATPIRLIASAIGVDASVESLGILPNGDLATPTQSPWTDVGWYNEGPRPGEHGSAVIDGHLDRPGGYPAVFWRLRDLQVGNQITIMFSDGTSRHFQVMRVAAYAPQDAPIQDIFGNINGNYLNLITCAGDWIPSEHQTTLRLVVYTTLI